MKVEIYALGLVVIAVIGIVIKRRRNTVTLSSMIPERGGYLPEGRPRLPLYLPESRAMLFAPEPEDDFVPITGKNSIICDGNTILEWNGRTHSMKVAAPPDAVQAFISEMGGLPIERVCYTHSPYGGDGAFLFENVTSLTSMA